MSGYGNVALALIGGTLSAYVLFGGADFGAGVWHLITRSARERRLIEHAMGPIWEANHVWLIFSMVLTWTAFPPVFATVMSDYWVPMSFAVLGIVIRGAGFAFGKTAPDTRSYRALFGLASVLTPFCLGSVAGAITSGARDWWASQAVYAGALAVGLCGYLAAVYLTWDARRQDGAKAAEALRYRAIITGVVVGVAAVPAAFGFGVAEPLVAVSAVAGVASLVLLITRTYVITRITSALAVASVVLGGVRLAASALDAETHVAADAALGPLLTAVGVAATVVTPSLIWLFVLFQRTSQTADTGPAERTMRKQA